MNGSWDIQQVLVASRQASLRYEADTTRLASAAADAVSAERTRHANESDTSGHMVEAPRAIAPAQVTKRAAQSGVATPTRSACAATAACSERTLAA